MLDPPQNGRVSHADAPLSHHGHQVSKTQLKAQIPTNTQDHDFLVEVPTFEQFLDWYESRHLSIIPDSWSVCTRALRAACCPSRIPQSTRIRRVPRQYGPGHPG